MAAFPDGPRAEASTAGPDVGVTPGKCLFIPAAAGLTRATMSKPIPAPFDPAQAKALALELVKNCKYPILASMDGDQARARPVSPVRTEGFVIYVANLKLYHKTVELAANPKCELVYVNEGHDQVRLTGVAEVLTDRAILQQIWDTNPLLRQYLGTIDNPALIVYRIKPTRVRYMKEWALEYHEVALG
jgi:general stress protein 26